MAGILTPAELRQRRLAGRASAALRRLQGTHRAETTPSVQQGSSGPPSRSAVGLFRQGQQRPDTRARRGPWDTRTSEAPVGAINAQVKFHFPKAYRSATPEALPPGGRLLAEALGNSPTRRRRRSKEPERHQDLVVTNPGAMVEAHRHPAMREIMLHTVGVVREHQRATIERGFERGHIPPGTHPATAVRAYKHAALRAMAKAGLIAYRTDMDRTAKRELRPLRRFMYYAHRRVFDHLNQPPLQGKWQPFREEFGELYRQKKHGKYTGVERMRMKAGDQFIKLDLNDDEALEKAARSHFGLKPHVRVPEPPNGVPRIGGAHLHVKDAAKAVERHFRVPRIGMLAKALEAEAHELDRQERIEHQMMGRRLGRTSAAGDALRALGRGRKLKPVTHELLHEHAREMGLPPPIGGMTRKQEDGGYEIQPLEKLSLGFTLGADPYAQSLGGYNTDPERQLRRAMRTRMRRRQPRLRLNTQRHLRRLLSGGITHQERWQLGATSAPFDPSYDNVFKSAPWKYVLAGAAGGTVGAGIGSHLAGHGGSATGSAVGGEIGATAGETLGSTIAGPIGGAAGGLIGGAAGSFLGNKFGPGNTRPKKPKGPRPPPVVKSPKIITKRFDRRDAAIAGAAGAGGLAGAGLGARHGYRSGTRRAAKSVGIFRDYRSTASQTAAAMDKLPVKLASLAVGNHIGRAVAEHSVRQGFSPSESLGRGLRAHYLVTEHLFAHTKPKPTREGSALRSHAANFLHRETREMRPLLGAMVRGRTIRHGLVGAVAGVAAGALGAAGGIAGYRRWKRSRLGKRYDVSKHPREHDGKFASKTGERVGRFLAGGAGAAGGYYLGARHGPRVAQRIGRRGGVLFGQLRHGTPFAAEHAEMVGGRLGRVLGGRYGALAGAAALGMGGFLAGSTVGAGLDRLGARRRAKRAGKLEQWRRLNAGIAVRPTSRKQAKRAIGAAIVAGKRIRRAHQTVSEILGKQDELEKGIIGAAMRFGAEQLPKITGFAARGGRATGRAFMGTRAGAATSRFAARPRVARVIGEAKHGGMKGFTAPMHMAGRLAGAAIGHPKAMAALGGAGLAADYAPVAYTGAHLAGLDKPREKKAGGIPQPPGLRKALPLLQLAAKVPAWKKAAIAGAGLAAGLGARPAAEAWQDHPEFRRAVGAGAGAAATLAISRGRARANVFRATRLLYHSGLRNALRQHVRVAQGGTPGPQFMHHVRNITHGVRRMMGAAPPPPPPNAAAARAAFRQAKASALGQAKAARKAGLQNIRRPSKLHIAAGALAGGYVGDKVRRPYRAPPLDQLASVNQ